MYNKQWIVLRSVPLGFAGVYPMLGLVGMGKHKSLSHVPPPVHSVATYFISNTVAY